MAFTLQGFVSLLLGLIVIMPLLGHASWHAYRDLVDVSDLPERTSSTQIQSTHLKTKENR